MRLGLIANYSRSSKNRIHEGRFCRQEARSAPLFAAREANKPADAGYPFGHTKIEAVVALAQTGFLAALSVGVAVQAIERKRGRERLRRGRRRVPSPWISRAGGR
jgi:divalent metal cation (Fe/Co/Zn/Cd) transporter